MTAEGIAGTIGAAGAAVVTGVVAAVDTSWPWPAIGVGLTCVALMNAALIKYVTADLKNTITTEVLASETRMETKFDKMFDKMNAKIDKRTDEMRQDYSKLADEMRHDYVRRGAFGG